MDVIRFHNPTAPTKMESGEIVNGLKNKLWVERYREAGEFKFVADASSKIKAALPIGAFISHVDTEELMIVENHEIAVNQDNRPEIVISGRGFETYLENRIVGMNQVFPTSDGATEYLLPLGSLWDQAVALIKDHTLAANLIDDNNAIAYLDVATSMGASSGIERSVKRGDLYKVLLDLLVISDLGIKTIRPGAGADQDVVNTKIVIHQGAGKKGRAALSADTGAIESSEYLWSNKDDKNAALVSGRWVTTFVSTAPVGYDRRVMFVDASDVDNGFTDAPVGADLDAVVLAMQARGNAAIATKNTLALTKAEFSKDAKDFVYRRDFNVGDLVTIIDDYNETTAMRITEYAEIEDENGNSGHPTLSLI